MYADTLKTPLGDMVAVADAQALYALYFADYPHAVHDDAPGRTPVTDQIRAELTAYFDGRLTSFITPMAPEGSAFSKSVWSVLRDIPFGETCSYSAVAAALGRPKAVRAVARAIAANPLLIIVPCHRVIGADGSLCGYSGGPERKRKLLKLELQPMPREVSSCL